MKKSLYIKLALFFLLITTIGSVVYLIITDSMAKSKNISLMINKIAYERMLTEKICKKSIEYILLNDVREKNELESLVFCKKKVQNCARIFAEFCHPID